MNRFFLLFAFVLYTSLCSLVKTPKNLTITVYNDNFAMIKDVRTIELDQGVSDLYFTDVAATIQAETVTFKAVDKKISLQIYEQNFENNLASKYELLKNYINKEVSIDVVQGQKAKNVRGILLAYEPAFLIKTTSGISIYDSVASVSVGDLPTGMLTQPTLVWKINSKDKTTTDCQLAYRASGFRWNADYLATINSDETALDFNGWVTIDNQSGKKYENVTVKLIAGDVNTLRPVYPANVTFLMTANAAGSGSGFSQKTFADYHMYSLSRKVNINESSKKQMEFIPVRTVKVNKYYEVSISSGGYNEENIKAVSIIQFLNSKDNGLGLAIPKGTVRVFKEDSSDGSLEFIGEDSVNHTPRDENVTLKTGNAFDITAKKIVSSRNSVSNGYDSNQKLEVKNHGDKTMIIKVVLNVGYGSSNLQLKQKANTSFQKESADKWMMWRQVKKDETLVLEWDESSRY